MEIEKKVDPTPPLIFNSASNDHISMTLGAKRIAPEPILGEKRKFDLDLLTSSS